MSFFESLRLLFAKSDADAHEPVTTPVHAAQLTTIFAKERLRGNLAWQCKKCLRICFFSGDDYYEKLQSTPTGSDLTVTCECGEPYKTVSR